MKRSAKVIITPEACVLRSLRNKRGMSMRTAGQVLGYSDSYVSQIENGRENAPKGEKLLEFLRAYGVKYKHFRQLVKDWDAGCDDGEVIRTILPKLKADHLKLLRSMAEQMAKHEI